MLTLPPSLIRVPRAWVEHPLPLSSPGVFPVVSYATPDDRLLTLTFGGIDRWQRTPPVPCPGLTLEAFTLLCALLTLTERRDGVTLTFNQLFRASTGSRSFCSSHHREKLKSTLAHLESLLVQVDEGGAPLHPAAVTGQDIYAKRDGHNETENFSTTTPVIEPLIKISPGVSRPVFGRIAPAFVIHFSPSFLGLFNDPRAVTPFDFSSFLTLRSRLGRALFPALSTWAHYNRAHPARPFRITFSRLITHLGAPVPRFRSQRRAFFFGHRAASLFDELLNLPTPHGPLQLKIEDASSVDDDCLCIWFGGGAVTATGHNTESENTSERKVLSPTPLSPNDVFTDSRAITKPSFLKETFSQPGQSIKPTHQSNFRDIPKTSAISFVPGGQDMGSHRIHSAAPPTPSSSPPSPVSSPLDALSSFRHLKIYQAWIASGRTDHDFISRVRAAAVTLTQDDLELLHTSRISPARCENFLLLSKKLLPQRTWLDLLGEAKYAALSHTPPKNPTGKLITEILTSVRAGV